MAAITAGSNDLGGPLVVDNSNSGFLTYRFTGSAASDFGDPRMWVSYAADTAGVPPVTLGYVDSALLYAAWTHRLGLPCCSNDKYDDGGKHPGTQPVSKTADGVIMVYPNPASATVYFEFPESAEARIRIMDITGRVMEEQAVHNNTMATFNVKSYTPGLYFYQVITNGRTQSGKLQIQ